MYVLARNQSGQITPTGQIEPITDSDWISGNTQSKTTLIEYADYQCPACGAYYPILKALKQNSGAEFRFVFRNFPLSQHKNAKPAAYAAGAAGGQGKYWEMHDMIFERQEQWSNASNAEALFISYAEFLGLNMEQFKNDIKSSEVMDKVQADYDGGLKAGVRATPTFYLNGRQIQPTSYEEFISAITQANAE